ncbi:ClpXP protease specificity-enhancing factor [Thaumasiovibrio subtropicus]|uniref:ClpXP protease specificity-enhancing factor n=1 Tax=Thaumasiovibrio subtropicus TaxID=1891207 RepID=UPI000B34F1F3|nr:ClpXP protease specificity-enhancing factor [Thaumasiovibrio subtropicus]
MEYDKLTPQRPYLLRAYYDWLVENDLTPHLVVDATLPGVRVPTEFVRDGQIVLNIAPRAVGNLELGNDAISFNARFSGRPHSVVVPMYAAMAIYARENGAGTMFEPEPAYAVQEDEHGFGASIEEADADFEPAAELAAIETETVEDDDSDPEPPRPRGRPSLRVVK